MKAKVASTVPVYLTPDAGLSLLVPLELVAEYSNRPKSAGGRGRLRQDRRKAGLIQRLCG